MSSEKGKREKLIFLEVSITSQNLIKIDSHPSYKFKIPKCQCQILNIFGLLAKLPKHLWEYHTKGEGEKRITEKGTDKLCVRDTKKRNSEIHLNVMLIGIDGKQLPWWFSNELKFLLVTTFLFCILSQWKSCKRAYFTLSTHLITFIELSRTHIKK